MHQSDRDRRSFWKRRRLLYNVAVLVSGFAAGVVFLAVFVAWVIWPPPADELEHADFELLSLALLPVGYAGAMLLANVCYLLGPASEKLLRPRNPEAFRRRIFGLGLWFSVALPWIVPLNAWYEFISVQLHR